MAIVYGTNIENGKVPSLDLRFSERKSLVDTISGRNLVTFTRGSSGTYFDSTGTLRTAAVNEARFDHNPVTGESLGLLVEEARTNSLSYSQGFDNSYWSRNHCNLLPNSIVAPDGTITAALLFATNTIETGIYRLDSLSGSYTHSIYVKKGTARYFIINTSSPLRRVWFDLDTGTVANSDAGVTGTIVSVGNGWYRCTATSSSPNRQTFLFGNSSTSLDSASGLTVYIWGAQLEAGSFPTTYIPTPATFTSRASTATFYDANGVIQTAGINVARSNAFFPDSNGVMRPAGLLLEAAGTNQISNSEQLNNWNLSSVTVTTNAIASPDGTTTADLLTSTGTNGNAYLIVTPGSVTLPATFSVFVKQGTSPNVTLYDGNLPTELTFTFATETISTVGSGISGSFQKLPNGWYRLWFVKESNWQGAVGVMVKTSGQTVYAWGAQLEYSTTYPTSYIPTTTATVTRSADVSSSATVTRSADVAQITGTNFSSWYRQSEGAFCLSAYRAFDPSGGALITVSSTGPQFLQITQFTTKMRLNTAWVNNQDVNTNAVGIPNKVAFALKSADLAITCNGGAITSNATSGLSSYVPTSMSIGYRGDYNDERYGGTISRITYWPVRLANATLQSITR